MEQGISSSARGSFQSFKSSCGHVTLSRAKQSECFLSAARTIFGTKCPPKHCLLLSGKFWKPILDTLNLIFYRVQLFNRREHLKTQKTWQKLFKKAWICWKRIKLKRRTRNRSKRWAFSTRITLMLLWRMEEILELFTDGSLKYLHWMTCDKRENYSTIMQNKTERSFNH